MNFIKACVLAISLFIFNSVNAQVMLGYHLEKGDVFMIRQEATQVITQQISDSEQEITNTISGIITFRVKDVYEESYEMEMKFVDLKLKMTSNVIGELLNIDAKKIDAENPQSKMFNGILDFPITFTMKKNGDIVSVKGGEDLVEHMLASADIDDDFTLDLMKTSLEKDYSSSALAENYKQMTFFYPNKSLNVNDEWKNSYHGDLSVFNIWKLTAFTTNEATLTADGRVNMLIQDPGILMSLQGSQKIKLIVNRNNGFLKKMIVEGMANGNSTMDEIGESDIPTIIKSKITYNLIN